MNSTSRKRSTRPHRKQSNTPKIPYGYCHCGCLRRTKISPKTDATHGYVAGEPRPYIFGHCTKARFPAKPRRQSRTIKVEGVLCRTVPLSDGSEAIVNIRDFTAVSKYYWNFNSKSDHSYVNARVDGITVRLHELIKRTPSGFVIDHRNGDRRDNRRNNLRVCRQRRNMCNLVKRKNCTSSKRGVSWHKDSSKWIAQITHAGVNEYIGSFLNEKEAAIAFDKRARKLFGTFGSFNYPQINERSALTGKVRFK